MALGLALLLIAGGQAAAGTCQPLHVEALSAQVRRVETEADRERRIDRLVDLAVYWDTLCATDREAASPEVVSAIAGLLRLGRPRRLIISMLFDIGPNLRTADAELKESIREEQRVDAEVFRQTRPVIPTNYGVAVDQLRCLRHKAKTGRTDAPECRLLLAVEAAERG